MSVYITGMEMPTSCFYCPFRRKIDPDNIMCIVTRECFEETYAGTIETRNRGNCPLIPVPDHGRLIDADALEYEEAYLNGHYELGDVEIVTREDIESAPTIIPADKEGEG